jgi:hypothetical protein
MAAAKAVSPSAREWSYCRAARWCVRAPYTVGRTTPQRGDVQQPSVRRPYVRGGGVHGGPVRDQARPLEPVTGPKLIGP